MRTLIILAVLLALPAFGQADTINVPADYATIQEAIDAAVNGDTVLVAPGTYVENIDFIGKAITVSSELGAGVTVIDGNGMLSSVVTCQSGEDENSVLDGFTITNGDAKKGGGMYNNSSSPTVTDCTFTDNYAGSYASDLFGGGMCNENCNPIVTNCIFTNNSTGDSVCDSYGVFDSYGGGMANKNSNPTVTNCAFTGNWASIHGGGMYNVDSSPTLTDCSFSGNDTGSGSGGGMANKNSDPTITNCTFTGNTANAFGGGIYNVDSTSTLDNCTFSENEADYQGGGMYNSNSSLMLTYCSFTGNSGYNGGGMFNEPCSPILTNCTFNGNSADNIGGGMYNDDSNPTFINCSFIENEADYQGGGIYNDGSNPLFTNCIFSRNLCTYGGGMLNEYNSNPTLTNCTFSENTAGDHGGAMRNSTSSPTLTNCTFFRNFGYYWGGGIFNIAGSEPTLTNCTFFENEAGYHGGGLFNSSSLPIVINCIFWNDTPSGIYNKYCNPNITYSCVQGGWPGTGNIDSNPLFVDSANNDFHLTYLSPCRGSGDNSAVTELFDFEGDPRICQYAVDMGADECYTHLYITGDQTPGSNIQGKFVGLPGTSPVYAIIGFDVYDPPKFTIYGDLYLKTPRILIPLIPIPANGILSIPATIPISPPAPYDIPMQGLVGLNSDSLTNLYELEVR